MSALLAVLPTVAGDGGVSDFGTTITAAFAGFAPQLMIVAAAGLAIAVTVWGFPKVVGFFKRTAK